MDNVLVVRTTKSNGRAWAAWYITEEKAKGLDYLVSVNGTEVTVYLINDYVMGYFFGNDYERAAFNLTDVSGTQFAYSIERACGDLYEAGWTIKFATY